MTGRFWPGSVAANKSILGGDPEKQIALIGSYLATGKQADLPPGLVQGTRELVADKESFIYRHFIQGAGSRAIGVGYPEKANLAFDANEMHRTFRDGKPIPRRVGDKTELLVPITFQGNEAGFVEEILW